MSNPLLSPLMGSRLRIENKSQLDEFLSRDDAPRLVRAASFEEVFFAVMAVGLADSLDLLPMVTGRQVRGFIDLDCWRKDTFVRKPFMEWIAAFIQSGPEETVRALSGIDDLVIALFLKELIAVIRQNPELTTGGLMEIWRGKKEEAFLANIASSEQMTPDAGMIDEFKGAMRQITNLGVDNEINRLLAKAAQDGLSEDEKIGLTRWISQKKAIV